MTKQPTPPASRWDIYKLAAKQTLIGEIDASDERGAIEIAGKRI